MSVEVPPISRAAVQFSVDQETCVKCGMCAKDCPFGIIAQEEDRFPTLSDENMCIRCQHCFTVCPTGSLSVLGNDPKEATTLKGNLPTQEQLITLIKGRRSVRQYLDESLPQETIDQLLEATWHAPTGHNFQQNLLTVVDNKETVDKVRTEIYQKIEQALAENMLDGHPAKDYFGMAVQMRKHAGADIIFRGAPHILVISSPENGASPVQDTIIALTTFDLLAPTMGVGTLWNGMLKWCLGLFPDIQEKLGVPNDHHIGYAMVFGKPAVNYQRTAVRNPVRVNRINDW